MLVSRIDVAKTKVGATKKIIEQPVGLNKGNPKDIVGIQRLLIRIGYPIGDKELGQFGADTTAALLHFQTNWLPDQCLLVKPSDLNNFKLPPVTQGVGLGQLPVRPFIDITDKVLFALADSAGVLLELSTATGAYAFLEVGRRVLGLPYRGFGTSPGKPHMFWGLDLPGYENYALMTGDANCSQRGRKNQFLPPEEPLAFHCTSFATVMLAVWHQGNCRKPPYDATLQWGADRAHVAADWGMKICSADADGTQVRLLSTEEQMAELFCANPQQLFLVELTQASMQAFGKDDTGTTVKYAVRWGVHHYALVNNFMAYQASQLQGRVICEPVSAFVGRCIQRGDRFYVWGPG
jgi:hypothetical protein